MQPSRMIFLAEDDSDDQDLVREIVGGLNRQVELRIFDDGEALLSSMKKLPQQFLPGLIILDQNMPKLKGSDTIRYLKDIHGFENVPVVIYTTYHDNRFEDACKRMNVELFRKPDTFEAFSDMLDSLMEKYISN